MTTVNYRMHSSPIGDLLLLGENGHLTGIYFEGQVRAPRIEPVWHRDSDVLAETARQLDAYLCGALTRFDLPLAPRGTPFQLGVWKALREIPYGRVLTYGELAWGLGTSARAVGAAVGRNPISIVIPCHRVVGKAGDLTGYAGGLRRKARLLALEAGKPSV